MTYINAVKYINAQKSTDSPERMRMLCRYLGDPQRQLRFIHVAGAAGKTSVIKMLDNIISDAGYLVGAYISPFALELREEITIAGKSVSHADFAEAVSKVAATVEKMKTDVEAAKSGKEQLFKVSKNLLDGKISPEPSAREVVVATALTIFKREFCDVVMLECGERRTDPTSIIDPPLVSVICGEKLDEEETKTAVGIIRRGTKEVVTSITDSENYNSILDACVKADLRLTVPVRSELKIEKRNLGGTSFVYRDKNYFLPACTDYQLTNAATAIEAAYALARTGAKITENNISDGISKSRIKSNFEVISAFPAIIADCPKSREALLSALENTKDFTGRKIYLTTPRDFAIISASDMEKIGFSVIETFSPTTEKEENFVLKKAVSLESDETLLIIGDKAFVERLKNRLKIKLAY